MIALHERGELVEASPQFRGPVKGGRSDAPKTLEQAQFISARDRCDPAVDAQLAIDVTDVGADRVDGNIKLIGDLGLG